MTLPNARFTREFTRFAKFLVVGAIGAVIDFGTFNLLTSAFNLWIVVAGTISFTAAVTSNFIWNYYWTYPDSRSKPVGQQVIQFILVNLIGLAIRTPILHFMEKPFTQLSNQFLAILPSSIPPGSESIFPLDEVTLGRNLALATAVIIVLFWNFGINRIWTYSDVK
jgi:putative flippase GtrA